MDKIRWNQLFTPRTLKRGYELYQSGAVEGIQHNDYAIKGSVFDDDDYNVDPVSRTLNKKVLKID